jgi:hypothetical protein
MCPPPLGDIGGITRDMSSFANIFFNSLNDDHTLFIHIAAVESEEKKKIMYK